MRRLCRDPVEKKNIGNMNFAVKKTELLTIAELSSNKFSFLKKWSFDNCRKYSFVNGENLSYDVTFGN
jgi:hypothetical protein